MRDRHLSSKRTQGLIELRDSHVDFAQVAVVESVINKALELRQKESETGKSSLHLSVRAPITFSKIST